MAKSKIGIVGLGIMGGGIATNFLKNKYKVFVWNRTSSVSESFVNKGGVVCQTPKEVAENSDIIFEITANDKSSRSVWFGNKGILAGADKSKVLIASATLSVDWTDYLAKECIKRRFVFMDIPLTGGRIGAETGNLTLLCGGDEKVLRKITPQLRSISGKIIYFGSAGHGMRYKLILNYLQALHIIGFGQAMAMAKKQQMNLKKVGEGLALRPGGVITEIANTTYFKNPEPITFSIEWITKDLTYAKKSAKGTDTKLLDEVLKVYKKAMKNGYSKEDWARINNLIYN